MVVTNKEKLILTLERLNDMNSTISALITQALDGEVTDSHITALANKLRNVSSSMSDFADRLEA